MVKKLVRENTRKQIQINEFVISIQPDDPGGILYASKSSYAFANDPLLAQTQDLLNPTTVLDVGANYGFTASVFSRSFPNAKILAVEASPVLEPYLQENLRRNSVGEYDIIMAVCGAEDQNKAGFSLNPNGSQDNRVVGGSSSWSNVETKMKSVASILREHHKGGGLFVKIDTQGFEEHVFKGGEEFFSTNDQWLIRSEFAPNWLESQGTCAKRFLQYLLGLYDVTEIPSRTRFKGDDIEKLFSDRLRVQDVDGFLEYIKKLDKNDRGWCDVFVRPKQK